MITLKGVAWNHSRGYVPAIATAQRYMELNKNVEIIWENRSLHDFGGADVNDLSKKYDIMIVDYPWSGYAYKNNSYEILNNYLDNDFLKDQEKNTVGKSFYSHQVDNKQMALAIDAAAPIAFYSKDKANSINFEIPKTYEEVLELAKKGYVAASLNGTSLLMQLYMFCDNKDIELFSNQEIAPIDIIENSLDEISNLINHLDKKYFYYNPIAIYDEIADIKKKALYTPFDFGYSNYSRVGYSTSIVLSCDVVSYKNKKLRTVLGGAGIALSSRCLNKEVAVDYIKYISSGEIQRSLFCDNGGQPGHRSAWVDERVNYLTNNFFINTLPTLDRAILRPNHSGCILFQEEATFKIKDYFLNKISKKEIIDFLVNGYKNSFNNEDIK